MSRGFLPQTRGGWAVVLCVALVIALCSGKISRKWEYNRWVMGSIRFDAQVENLPGMGVDYLELAKYRTDDPYHVRCSHSVVKRRWNRKVSKRSIMRSG